MPTDESEFKLVIIYAGKSHTERYIDFFNNIRQLDFHMVIDAGNALNGCVTLSKIQLDKLNKILGYIKNQYDNDQTNLTNFLTRDGENIKVKYAFYEMLDHDSSKHISIIKNNITYLREKILDIQQKDQHYETSTEYILKTKLLEKLILYKKQQSLEHVEFRNKMHNLKKRILTPTKVGVNSDLQSKSVLHSATSVAGVNSDEYSSSVLHSATSVAGVNNPYDAIESPLGYSHDADTYYYDHIASHPTNIYYDPIASHPTDTTRRTCIGSCVTQGGYNSNKWFNHCY
jgi:hypothetical protein